MTKVLSRLGRVVSRVFRPLARLLRAWRWIVLGLGPIGILAAAQQGWTTYILPWFKADPAHLWLTGVSILCVLALAALYGWEREADALRLNGVKIEDHFVYLARWWEKENRVTVDLRIAFINNSDLQTLVILKKARLQRKYSWRWRTEPYDFTKIIDHYGVVCDEALIPARQRHSHDFSIAGRRLEGAQLPTPQDRLKITLRIAGQLDEEIIVWLPEPRYDLD